MRALLCGLAALLVAGCVTPNAIKPTFNASLDSLQDGHAVVAMNLNVLLKPPEKGLVQPSLIGAWIPVDPSTGFRIGKTMVYFELEGGLFTSNSKRSTGYQAYVLPAGTYALGWLTFRDHIYEPTLFQRISIETNQYLKRNFSDLARIRPITPVFTVRPGEVIYIGDLTFDVRRDGEVHWSLASRADDAKTFLKTKGLDGRMAVRLLKRPDGKDVQTDDGVLDTVKEWEKINHWNDSVENRTEK